MEFMSKNKLWLDTKSIIIVILLILLFLLNKCKNNLKVEPITKVTTVVDTVTIIKRDTVTRYVKLKVPTPVISITPDGDTLQTYVQEYSDSILDATITATLKCKLDSWRFKYKPKIPLTITKTITVEKLTTNTVTETVKENKNMLFLNSLFAKNANKFDIGLGVSFYHKKGYLYQLNYLPLTKGVAGGISFQLNR
jgi:hypothetical protein